MFVEIGKLLPLIRFALFIMGSLFLFYNPLTFCVVDFPGLINCWFPFPFSLGSTEEYWRRQDAAQAIALVGIVYAVALLQLNCMLSRHYLPAEFTFLFAFDWKVLTLDHS